MRRLLIMRHAQASSDLSSSDFARPLTAEGRQQALRQADWLRDRDLRPDAVLASPASRSRETAILVCDHLGVDPRHGQLIRSIYEASAGDLVRVLDEVTTVDRVLLVGHNPGVSALASFLAGSYATLRPASIAELAFEPATRGTLQPGSAQSIELHHASES